MKNLTSLINFARPLAAVLLLGVTGAGWAQVPVPSPAALEGLDAVAAVELANAWKGNDVTSYATTEAVVFSFPDGSEVVVPMPEDQVFVSVAPYLQATHPCTTHYMSGCQGELVGLPVQVRALRPDGTVAFDEIVETGANGFLDLWLPRGEALLLDLFVDGYGAQSIVTTHDGSPTCITTMQLRQSGS